MKQAQIITDVLDVIKRGQVGVTYQREITQTEIIFQRKAYDNSWVRYVVVRLPSAGEGPFLYHVDFLTYSNVQRATEHELSRVEYNGETEYQKLCKVIAQYLRRGKDGKGVPDF